MNKKQKNKINMLNDFVAVQKGMMLLEVFCEKWDVPYRQFIIAYSAKEIIDVIKKHIKGGKLTTEAIMEIAARQ